MDKIELEMESLAKSLSKAMKKRAKVNEDTMNKAEIQSEVEAILETAQILGVAGLKKAVEGLSDLQKGILMEILTKGKKSPEMPMAASDNAKPQKAQEPLTSERSNERSTKEDDKLVKPANAEIQHQGDSSPEGREGQKIEDPKDKGEEEEDEKPLNKLSVSDTSEKEDEEERKHQKKNSVKKALVNGAGEKYEADSEAVDPYAKDKSKSNPYKKNIKDAAKEDAKEGKKMSKAESLPMAGKGKTNLKHADDVLKSMIERMQERQMKKSEVFEKFDAQGYDLDTIAKIWESVEKAMKEPKKDEKKEEKPKMEKKMAKSWTEFDNNSFFLGADKKRGINAHYDTVDQLEKDTKETAETIKKGGYLNDSGEKLTKSTPKVDINDIIEKGGDFSDCGLETAKQVIASKVSAKFMKSFDDSDLETALGIDAAKAEEILKGKK